MGSIYQLKPAFQGLLQPLVLLAKPPSEEMDATMQARALIGASGPVAQEGDLAAAQRRLGEAIGI
jgi:hypothetical protein